MNETRGERFGIAAPAESSADLVSAHYWVFCGRGEFALARMGRTAGSVPTVTSHFVRSADYLAAAACAALAFHSRWPAH